jgi:hypothetical protein
MRIHHWAVLVVGIFLTASFGHPILAQEASDEDFEGTDYGNEADFESPLSNPYGAAAAPRCGAFQPATYSTEGAQQLPGPVSNYQPAQIPSTPQAYPGISPYSLHNEEQLYNMGGLWHHDTNDDTHRTYILGFDMLIGDGASPGPHLLGDEYFSEHIYPTDSTFPFPPFTRLTNYDPGSVAPSPFWPLRTTGPFTRMKHYGFRASYGWENYDDSGFMLSGFYLFDDEATRRFGSRPANGDLSRIDMGIFRLPLNDGTDFGKLIVFDGDLVMGYDQQMHGIDADAYLAPFYERPNFKLRWNWGVKYLHVYERFWFTATDSGWDYTWDITDGSIATLIIPPLVAPFATTVEARTTSQMIGPQMGLRYDLGGERLKFWGQTKVAVAANMEKVTVLSTNLRDHADQFFTGQGGSTQHQKDHTRIVPVLDTSINAEIALFQMVPGFHKLALFTNAKFRFGYNFVLAGELSRPAKVIDYTYESAQIKTSRTWFNMHILNMGVDWRF